MDKIIGIVSIGCFILLIVGISYVGSTPLNFSDEEYIEEEEVELTRRQAVREHWDEIKEYVNGTGFVEACYDYGDHCYNLKVDLSYGEIRNLYFPNGGYLDFDGVELDREGFGEATSNDDREWYFDLDLDNDAVYSAIDVWAEDNSRYGITYDPPDPDAVARMQNRIKELEKNRTIAYFAAQSELEDLYQGPLDEE